MNRVLENIRKIIDIATDATGNLHATKWSNDENILCATNLEDKKIHVEFADGMSGVFDMTPYIRSDFFRSLENEEYFKKVRIFFGGIGWHEGKDIGPDTIAADLRVAQ